jgi:tetratricopeptide (TPR) repeat protein
MRNTYRARCRHRLKIIFVSLLFVGNPSQSGAANTAATAQHFIDLGTTLSSQQRYQEAIDAYSKVLDLCVKEAPVPDPTEGTSSINQLSLDIVIAAFQRGKAYSALNNHAQAIDDYTRGLVILSKHTGFEGVIGGHFCLRGVEYEKVNQFADAISDFKTCIQRAPGEIFAYQRMAVMHYQQQNYRAAIADADAFLARDKTQAQVFFIRGASKAAINEKSAVFDLLIAAKMGDPSAQHMLEQAGINWRG